ncbi:MAG: HAD family hydrolase [Christensenellales bacterium]|jgi:phosphoglycolate phosphatase|nr:HAD family hydrolase [Clostridiales bacterium]
MSTPTVNYDYLLWDWNGTLYNDVDASIKSINISLKEYNLPLLDKERYMEIFCFPVEEYYKKLGFDFEVASYDMLAKDFIRNFLIESKKSAFLQDGAKEVLRHFHALGIKQSILSASEKDILTERLVFYGIDGYFEEILALDNIYAESKLDLGLNWISKQNGDKKIALIGDSPHDYEVASAMGIDCILFTGGHGKKPELELKDAIVIDDLRQLKEIINTEKQSAYSKIAQVMT